ncbi:hypothetical protein C900_05913 [Fulvivirga imtechensis AK7]|uniref:IPT/TIG domain-containing protein n=1 Tax=Fulvivirga imtechensis AK7 TaxID=1237149 RepID=L8JIU4_9BACT|nr:IPT/TIG domain-containing protein [Fulvivirga imtechensis]ELR68730.1 hypothetical protein C900_05913 [Fulvivirga imtechensis AK7]
MRLKQIYFLLACFLLLFSCRDDEQMPSPIIQDFEPKQGVEGSTFVIIGKNFGNVPSRNIVSIGDIIAEVTDASSSRLTVKVPDSAETGLLSVTHNQQTTVSSDSFKVIYAPIIQSFLPEKGTAGTEVTIAGSNFCPQNIEVKFNGVLADVVQAAPSALKVTVPVGATTGSISITCNGLTAESQDHFTVISSPVIESFSPAIGPEGAEITILGNNFSSNAQANEVKFNGVLADVVEAEASSLKVTVPVGATTGSISITCNGLTAESQDHFTIINTPVIESFSPVIGPEGTEVTILGNNFSSNAQDNEVKFNGVLADVVEATASSLKVTVPVGATTGSIGITCNGLTAESQDYFTVISSPIIESFSPVMGPEGAEVTILGNNFSSNAQDNIVQFNNVAAEVITSSITLLTAIVPSGATTGFLTVTSNGLTTESESDFVVTTLPEVTTTSIYNITNVTAEAGGNITSDGGATILARGLCWSTTPTPTIDDYKTADGGGNGTYYRILTGLTPGTTYFLRAYATNNVGTAYGEELSFATMISTTGTVEDADGNIYSTVVIGTQNWMSENLKVTRYQNGDAIPVVTDQTTWYELTTGAMCYYDNDQTAYEDPYGALYNGYVVTNGEVCPDGWHVPTKEDWESLFESLGGKEVAGGKMKEAGYDHWNSGNTEADNTSGFTALGAGSRYTGDARFINMGIYTIFWSSSPSLYGNYDVPLYSSSSEASIGGSVKRGGYSIRCIQD